jgi:hypothetical protein
MRMSDIALQHGSFTLTDVDQRNVDKYSIVHCRLKA